MKNIILALAALVTVPAFASDRFVCNSYDRSTEKLGQETVVLVSLEDFEVREGKPARFQLEFYNGAENLPSFDKEGIVNVEDVSFEFVSNDGEVRFHIFLDELYESSLTISGKERESYICR